jgi:NAD(P)-dependent dehydrogenase (short-subunit alcohol dehydrogenase family)
VIINFHSTTAYKVPSPGLAHYIASKGGVEALTHSLAVEFGPRTSGCSASLRP